MSWKSVAPNGQSVSKRHSTELWVAIAIVCVLAALFFILWIPIDLVVRLDVRGRIILQNKAVWLFGLLTRELGPKRQKPKGLEKKPKPKQMWSRRRLGMWTLIKILRTEGMLRQITHLLKDLFTQIHFRSLRVNMTIGLGDPADTGLLFAIISPIIMFLNPSLSGRIAVQPAFVGDAVCEGYVQGAFRLQPINLVIPLGKFIFSRTGMRLSRTFVKNIWKTRSN